MTWECGYPPEHVVPWSATWSVSYERRVADLRRSLGPGWVFEHVGSTSVPGLDAKPVIDIAVRLPCWTTLGVADAAFRAAGWSDVVDVGDHAASVLAHENERVAIAHLFTADQWPQAHLRVFAEWMRSHAEDRLRYAALKRRLVTDGVWGSAYTTAKSSFVREIVDKARAARGLPPAGDL